MKPAVAAGAVVRHHDRIVSKKDLSLKETATYESFEMKVCKVFHELQKT